jgi:CubicO group peptidase (beta-lactamase class C family)
MDVRFPLYSFSKGVTATVAVMVRQEGLLDYDAPVSRYVPEYAGGGKEGTTVRHLLTHAAGVPAVPLGPVATEEQWREAVQTLCAAEAEWAPGSKTHYHALTGPFMAAEIVRRVTGGAPWSAICRERLFEPLGAEGFTFELPPASPDLAIVPQPDELPFPLDVDHMPYAGHPAGGCFGRMADIMKLMQLHLNRGVWRGERLIEEAAWEEMHSFQYAGEIAAAQAKGEPPSHEYWGIGWLLRGETQEGWFGFGDQVSEKAFGHAGIDTVMTVGDPETGLAIAFTTTDSLPSQEDCIRLRNGVTNRVAAALKTA